MDVPQGSGEGMLAITDVDVTLLSELHEPLATSNIYAHTCLCRDVTKVYRFGEENGFVTQVEAYTDLFLG